MKKHYRHENDCLNCGTILEGKFCHNCGQENLQVKESFGHMMNHAISDYFHFDHQFFHTLKPLLFKPGYLTNEYMAGRRVQYLHPVKMYIFISVVYFLLLFNTGNQTTPKDSHLQAVTTQKLLDSVNYNLAKDSSLTPAQKRALQKKVLTYTKNYQNFEHKPFVFGDDSTYKQYAARQDKLPTDERDGFFERSLKERFLSYNDRYGVRAKEVFGEELQHNIPKMMFVLLPVFALILGITFWKSKKFYVEHLIYSFHLHCFLFLFLGMVMLVSMPFPKSWDVSEWLGFLAFIYIVWYIYKSLKAVYHRGGFRTSTKMIGMSFAYFTMVTICFMLVILITALF
jgi:hypothetical protein